MQGEHSVSCDVVIAYHEPAIPYLATAIDSILNQQDAQCYIHLVADAVPEEKAEAIRQMYVDAPNMFFYRNEETLGPYRSFHSVFDSLKTDYIAVQDSDDIALPHRIWHSVTALQKSQCKIFGGAMENFIDWRSNDSQSPNSYLEEQGQIARSGIQEDYCPSGRVNNPTMVVAKSAFEELNGFADWYCGADNEFVERAHQAGVPVHFSDAVVVLRRLHKNSMVQNEDTGMHTNFQEKSARRLRDRYLQFTEGFDPKPFGSLRKELSKSIEKKNKFVIIGAPRAGSSLLVEVLNRHVEVCCYSELFMGGADLKAYRLKPEQYMQDTVWRDENPKEFLEYVYNQNHSEFTTGFKIFADQNDQACKVALEDTSVKKILLHRKNIIRQYVSLHIAVQTGFWLKDTPNKAQNKCFHVYPAALQHFIDKHEAYHEEARNLLKKTGQEYLELSYEDLVGPEKHKHYREVFDFLEVDASVDVSSNLIKQNPEPLKSLIKNFEEIEKALKGTKYEHCLHGDEYAFSNNEEPTATPKEDVVLEGGEKFAIIATPRTGSTYLVEALNTLSGVHCYGELFNEGITSKSSILQTLHPEETMQDVDWRDDNPLQFLKYVWRQNHGQRSTGFKFIIGQDEEVYSELLADKSVKKILLKRRNIVRQFASNCRAALFKTRTITTPENRNSSKITLHRAALLNFIKRINRRYVVAEKKMTASNQDYLEIFYEDLVGLKRQDCLKKISAFLGAEVIEPHVSPYIRQNPEPLIDLIENYQEIADCLKGTPYENMLEEDELEQKKGNFVIIGSARTGSNYLVESLRKHKDICCHTELYSKGATDSSPMLTRLDPAETMRSIAWRNAHPVEFLNGIWKSTHTRSIIGFKLIFDQSPEALEAVVNDTDVQKIIIRRKNRVRQYVSFQIALQSKVWGVRNGEQTQSANITIDPELFKEYASHVEYHYSQLLKRLEDSGQEYVEIYYEEVMGPNREKYMEKICTFLGAEYKEGLSASLIKQNAGPLSKVIENYEEVEAALKGTQFESMLYQEDLDCSSAKVSAQVEPGPLVKS
ncbi:MAG: glycosyltransferase [Candidatus Peribacter sp.]|nr:glycosyltransferase [Candidatus Peribacter sp.]MBT6823597.1 glycosyltransferase [Candidatus Peribacter sp.]MBT7494259.1 glycosyltransferase [Candidatus Peribacter sp.]MBT7762119.1 glycosyltransferase [Candidatus Peribacter sp.]